LGGYPALRIDLVSEDSDAPPKKEVLESEITFAVPMRWVFLPMVTVLPWHINVSRYNRGVCRNGFFCFLIFHAEFNRISGSELFYNPG